MDGVTLNTEPLYTRAEINLFNKYNVIIPEEDWSLFRDDFFKRSSFPQNAQDASEYLTNRLDKAYSVYFASESKNNYAKVVDGEWSIGVDEKDNLTSEEKKNQPTHYFQ